MKSHYVESIPAVKRVSDFFKKQNIHLPSTIKTDIESVIEGVEKLDGEVKQKEQLLVQKDQKLGELQGSIFDKEQKEFIEVLPKLYPNDYPSSNPKEWSNDLWGKQVVERKNLEAIERHLPTFKLNVLKNKFIEVLQQRFPHDYSARFEDWPNIWGKQVINRGDVEAMQKWIPIYEKEIKENLKQSVLSEKTAKENELKKLAVKEQETLELKEQLRLKELETQNKDQLLLAKELEKQELARLKEIEKEELLAQKEVELANKSLVKNQFIGELQEDIGLKEKEAYKLQIELLMKQVEFHKKESELKDKALEDAHEIAKQNKMINELQGKLLELKALYGNDVSFSEEFSAIQFRAENSIENRDFGDIQDLARHIDGLVEAGRENSDPMSLATLMALNESPIIHGEEQPIYRSIYLEDRSCQPGDSLAGRQMESLNISSVDRQNQVVQTGGSLIVGEQMPALLNQGNIMNQGVQNQNLIGSFDNQHITHSVVLGGEGSESYEIIQQESFH